MIRTSFGALVQRHRLALSLCGIVAGSAVIIPACSGGPGNILTTNAGSITIVEVVPANDAQDFNFTTVGIGLSAFSLDDDPSDATLSDTKTFSTLLTNVVYTVNVGATSGWALPVISCTSTGGAGSAYTYTPLGVAVTLAQSADVTCVFTHSRVTPGSITIVKDAQPNDAQDFTFTSNQTTIPMFPLDDDADATLSDQRTFTNLPPAIYSFTETAVSGWNLTAIVCTPTGGTTTSVGTGTATIALAAGEHVTCTFTNTVVPAATGTLTIIKDAQPDDAQDFHFATVGAGLSAFDLDDDPSNGALTNSKTFTGLAAGVAFTVTEDAVAGWTVPSLQCLVAVPGLTTTYTDQLNRTFTVNLEAGANVTCTFINTRTTPVTGSITIVKDAQPNSAQDFAFTHSIAGSPGFSLDDDADATLSDRRVFSNLAAGTYTFSETAVSGWNLTSVVCSPSAGTSTNVAGTLTVVLTAGANVICTFTNTQPTGTLTIVKDAVPNDVQGFHFTTTGGAGLADFDLDDDGNDSNALPSSRTYILPAGAYSITEGAVAGWTLQNITCTQGGAANSNVTGSVPVVNVTLGAGGTLTCTFNNTKP